MSVSLSGEQEQLTVTLRQAAEQHWPMQRVLAAAEDAAAPDDAALWQALVQIGAPGLGLPETGGSLLDLGLAVAEGGYALLPGALLAHGAAARLAAGVEGASAARWTADLAEVRSRASTCFLPQEPPRLRPAPVGWALTGTVSSVLAAERADVLVMIARGEAGDAIVAVPLAAPGVEVSAAPGLDLTRRWSRVALVDVELGTEGVLAQGPAVAEAVTRAARDGALLVGFDSVGSAQRTLDDAVAYARVRKQFGRPIGAFQAVKHMLVDAHVAVDNARSSLLYAAWASDAHPSDELFAVHAAAALASDVHNEVAAAAVQVFGGIGFTRDVAAHLHVRRARANERLFGDPLHHRRKVADHLGAAMALWSTEGAADQASTTDRRDSC